MINIIVAVDENFAIGRENALLVHIPEDLKYFKEKTLGQMVVMGRKTYESLPFKPLKGRENIVLSQSDVEFPGCKVCKTVEEVIAYYQKFQEDRELFVSGGSSVYEAFLPLAKRLYITYIYRSFEADTFFLPLLCEWREISREKHVSSKDSTLAFDFVVYEK